MSSHHIVREKQEPALLIISIDGFNHEHLGQLLEWSPTVMVVDGILDQVLSLGIKIDIVLVDGQSNTFLEQEHILQLPFQDNSLKAGVDYFISEGYSAVNVIDCTFNAEQYLLYVDAIDIVVFNQILKIYPIKSGFSKWQVANEAIAVLYPKSINGITFNGLEHTKENNFETIKDGLFSFTFNSSFIFLSEQL